MILRSGCVQVAHVRQKKSWNFTRDEHIGVNFYELKETNARSLFPPMENEPVTLEHNTSQEIEV